MNLTFSAVVLAAALVAAQSSPTISKPAILDTPHLTITTSTSAPTVSPGGRLSLVVDVAPKPKMHLYAPEEKAQQPVSLKVDRVTSIRARSPIFPKGESLFFAPTGETQIVYSRPFRIEVPVTILESQKAGTLALSGTIRYQACDDKVCYIAKSVPLTWEVTIH